MPPKWVSYWFIFTTIIVLWGESYFLHLLRPPCSLHGYGSRLMSQMLRIASFARGVW
jgi:hypothetical protein